MRIKTRVKINSLLSIAMILLTLLMVVKISRDRNHADRVSQTVIEILKGVYELNILTNDYLRDQSGLAKAQWATRYGSLSKKIEQVTFGPGEYALFKNKLQEQSLKLKQMFDQVVAIREESDGRPDSGSRSDELRARMVERLIAAIQAMASMATQLSNTAALASMASHRKINFLLAAIAFIVVLFSIIYSTFMKQRILKPILALRAGVRKIGEGQLDHKIGMAKGDELGDFAAAFDRMTEKLKSITVSRDELEAEIKDRVEIEARLRENMELFKAVFEQAGGYCMILKPTDSGIPVILDANQAACRSHGYTKKEMIGRPVADLDDEDGKRMCRENTKIILSGRTLAIENVHVRKDGSTFPAAVFANRVDFADKPPLIVTTEFDISERHKAEAERQQLERQLQQSQKMESIGNLAGGIAHDFNNILASIIGFTELALDEAAKGSSLEDNLQEVYKAGARAKDLVNQILAFARQSDEARKPVQVGSVAKEVLKLIRSTIPATIEIKDQIESRSLILANPSQVHQLVMNVCTNAAQAMDDTGGVMAVRLTDVALDDSAATPLKVNPGDYLKLTVSDTGCGISPDLIDSVFEPYFTTKGVGQGTGMGLAMVHGIVESYGGDITVDSQVGKGSSFSIYLPVTLKREPGVHYAEKKLPTGSERILFVDDEQPIAKMGGQVLERLGYRVTVRTSSVEALELFRARPDEFDLVITDMTMPNMTGDRLAVEVMAIRPDIPVVLCTGYSKRISEETAAEIGIRAFAYKPVVKAELAGTVRHVLDGEIGDADRHH